MALFGRDTQRNEQRAQQWAQWCNSQNPYAIVSLVLGLLSLIEAGVLIVFGVAGIVFGVVGLREISLGLDPIRRNGRKLAWAGIVMSVISLILALLLYLRVFG